MRILLAASALFVAAAPASDQVPAATPAGDPVNCLSVSQVRDTIVRDARTIDFVTRGGKVYRNTLDSGRCPGLAAERRFLHRSSTGQYCSVDTITVLYSPLERGASCGLGKFQPVRLAK